MARGVDLVDLVEDDGIGLQRAKAMRKTFRDENLLAAFTIQLDGDERRRSTAISRMAPLNTRISFAWAKGGR